MKYTFGRDEKLKSRKAISQLFTEGKSLKKFPLKLIYLKAGDSLNTQVAFSVPKRNFKLAVHRNRIKRLMREAYRLQRPNVIPELPYHFNVMIIYMGKDMPNYQDVNNTLMKLLQNFKSSLK